LLKGNNLDHPQIGSNFSPFKRYVNAEYSDKLNEPRSSSVTGEPLPNPRLISRTLLDITPLTENYFTHLTSFFGQYIAFDLTHAAISKLQLKYFSKLSEQSE
jgi:hypothetical protein